MVGTVSGLARVKDDRISVYTARDNVPPGAIRALRWDPGGHLWIGGDGGLGRWANGQFISGERTGLPQSPVTALSLDHERTLWVGTADRGLLRQSGDRLVPYTSIDGLPADAVKSIYQDPDGDIWAGTNGGLVRLRTSRVTVLTAKDGLARDPSRTIHRGAMDDMWDRGR